MPPKAARPQAARPKAARPKASRAKATRPKATRPKAPRAKANRPKAAGPKATRPKPSRPPSTAKATGAPHVKCKHVYRKRGGWEVRCKGRACDEYGGWFQDHGAAVLRACELYGLSEDQLRGPGPAEKASRRERTCERTIYKGILKVGSQRYQVQPFGTYLGVRGTLEDALQLALERNAHISREDLMRDGAPGVAAKAACSRSSVSSLSSAGACGAARTAGAGSVESPPEAAAARSPRIRKRLRPLSASNSCQQATPISDLSAEQFREFFGCLWAVYGQPDEEFLPADLSDMVARLRGRRRVRAHRCGLAASLHTCWWLQLTLYIACQRSPDHVLHTYASSCRPLRRALPHAGAGVVLLLGRPQVRPGPRCVGSGRRRGRSSRCGHGGQTDSLEQRCSNDADGTAAVGGWGCAGGVQLWQQTFAALGQIARERSLRNNCTACCAPPWPAWTAARSSSSRGSGATFLLFGGGQLAPP